MAGKFISQIYRSSSGCRNGMKSPARNSADATVVEGSSDESAQQRRGSGTGASRSAQ